MYLERFDPAVVEERRVATKNFLNYALQHLYLRTHDAYINFFQVIDIISLFFYHLSMLIQFRKVKKFYYLMLKQLHYNLKKSLHNHQYHHIQIRFQYHQMNHQ
jgi:hypothetical protein